VSGFSSEKWSMFRGAGDTIILYVCVYRAEAGRDRMEHSFQGKVAEVLFDIAFLYECWDGGVKGRSTYGGAPVGSRWRV
jgi:hypothetical protein